MTSLVIVNKKYIRNVTFITVISKAIISNVFVSIVVLSHTDKGFFTRKILEGDFTIS